MATISNATNWANIVHKNYMYVTKTASVTIESIVQQTKSKAFTRNLFEHSLNFTVG